MWIKNVANPNKPKDNKNRRQYSTKLKKNKTQPLKIVK